MLWEDGAVDMLDKRDAYTRKAIVKEIGDTLRREFNNRAGGSSVRFDPEREGYITPVLDDRFGVVWYFNDAQKIALVKAVGPIVADLRKGSEAELKDYIQRVVKHESKGKVIIP